VLYQAVESESREKKLRNDQIGHVAVQIESFAGGIGGAGRRGFGAVRVGPGLCEESLIYAQLALQTTNFIELFQYNPRSANHLFPNSCPGPTPDSGAPIVGSAAGLNTV
jgi:hypothetical protein